MLEQNCLVCNFGDRDEIDPPRPCRYERVGTAVPGALLRNTCKTISARLVEDEGVPVIDEALDDLMGSFLGGFPGFPMMDDFE